MSAAWQGDTQYERHLPREVLDMVRSTARNVEALGRSVHVRNSTSHTSRGSKSQKQPDASARNSSLYHQRADDGEYHDHRGSRYEVESVDEPPPPRHHPNERRSRNRSPDTDIPRPPISESASRDAHEFSSDIGKRWGPALQQLALSISGQAPTGSVAPTEHLAIERDVGKAHEAELAKLKIDVKEMQRVHEEAVSHLRLDHAREVNRVRDEMIAQRQQAVEDATERMLASFAVKQQLLHSETENYKSLLDSANHRAAELEKKVFVLVSDYAASQHHVQALQRDIEEKKRHASLSATDLDSLKKDLTRAEEAAHSREAEVRSCRSREATLQNELKTTQATLDQFREALREQEALAKKNLQTVSDDFDSANRMYQDLLTKATTRLERYEKLKVRQQELKEQLSAKEKALHLQVTATEAAERRLLEEATRTDAERQSLRDELHRKEHELREERALGRIAIEDCNETARARREEGEMRVAELSRENAKLQKTLDKLTNEAQVTAGSVKHLQEQNVKQSTELARVQREMAEKTAKFRDALGETRSSADEAIASLNRQLDEKDKKLQAIVAANVEDGTLRKLRKQLEDERSRRAALEEQLAQMRQKAKEAEEHAMLEVRREQLRQPQLHSTTPKQKIVVTATVQPQRPLPDPTPNAEKKAPSPTVVDRIPLPNAPVPPTSAVATARPLDPLPAGGPTVASIHQRIAASREEFLAKCVNIVRRVKYRQPRSSGKPPRGDWEGHSDSGDESDD